MNGGVSGIAGAQTAAEAGGGEQSEMMRGPCAPRGIHGIPAWLDAADSEDGSNDSEASGPPGATLPEVCLPLHN